MEYDKDKREIKLNRRLNELDKFFLKSQEKQIEALYRKIQLAYWNAITTGKKEAYEEYEKASLEFKKFFNSRENFEYTKKFMGEESGEIAKRQLKLLHDAYLSSQGDFELLSRIIKISAKVEEAFNLFRAKVRGKEYSANEIEKILKTEKDSGKLKEFWEASKKQGELVEKDVLELVKLRNQLAKSLGFDNYYEFSLETNEQKVEELKKIFSELALKTKIPFEKLKEDIDDFLIKKYNISKNELKPWHYGDLFFQEGPHIYEIDLDKYYSGDILEKAKKYYQSIGLDVKSILQNSDLYERKGKYPHACCMDMDRNGDVRTVQNLKNNEKWMETLLHELGHAVYSKNFDFSLPFLLRDNAHIFVTEAIAMLFGRKSKNPEFLRDYSRINENDKEKIKEVTKKMLKLRQLVFARWVLVMFNFERELYKNPEQNLNELWWNLVKKYQLIDFSRNSPDWASKIHLVAYPVYYHNYMLGELLASQLHNFILKNIIKNNYDSDYSNSIETGRYLIENIFKHGAKYRWDELIKKATGEELKADYFVKEFIETEKRT